MAGDRGRPHPSSGPQKPDCSTQFATWLERARLAPLPQHGVAQGARQRAAAQLSFDEVILRSAPYRLVGEILVGETGQYDHRDAWRGIPDGSQTAQPLTVGKREVQENQVYLAAPEPNHARQQGLHPLDVEPGALTLGEHRPHQSGISRIVLDEKHPHRFCGQIRAACHTSSSDRSGRAAAGFSMSRLAKSKIVHGHSRGGSMTKASQKLLIACTTFINWFRSTGFTM